jgi:hypothetical protein
MISRIIKSKIRSITLANRALLFLNFCVLCFVCGSTRTTAISLGLGLFDYALLVLVDHYYVLYCLLPIMLVVITKHIRSMSDIEKVRYQSATQMMQVEILSFISWFGLYLLVSLGVVLLVGLTTFKPNLYATDIGTTGHNEILLLLSEYKDFSVFPVISILTALLYYCFGFATLTALLSLINNIKGLRDTISAAVIILVLTFIGFHTPLANKLPVLFLNNYLILHHGLFLNGLPAFLMTLLVGSGIILYAMGVRLPTIETASILDELTISRKTKRIVALFIISLIAIEVFQMLYEANLYPRDLVIRLMLGSSGEFRSFLGWIKISLIYLFPLFFIGVSISKVNQYKELPIFIRYGSFGKLRWRILVRYTGFLLLYVGLLATFLCVLFFIGNSSSPYNLLLEENIGSAFTPAHFIAYLIVFLISMVFNLVLFLVLSMLFNETAAFVSILLISFAAFLAPGFSFLDINPGILSFLESLQQGKSLLAIRVSVFALISAIYFGLAKRRTYANNQSR